MKSDCSTTVNGRLLCSSNVENFISKSFELAINLMPLKYTSRTDDRIYLCVSICNHLENVSIAGNAVTRNW